MSGTSSVVDNMTTSSDLASTKALDPVLHVGKCSDLRSVFNVILTAIGIGIIALPNVFANCGWIGGFLALICAASVSIFMTNLLFTVLTNHPSGEQPSTYEGIARLYYGRVGKNIAGLSIHLTMLGCCTVLLVLLAQHLCMAIGGESVMAKMPLTIICGVVLAPLTWLETLHEVSYVSAFGILSIVALVIVIVVAGVKESLEPTYNGENKTYDLVGNDVVQIGSSIATCFLSFCIANVVANLVKDMKNPSHFPRVSIMGHVNNFVVYSMIGAAGYAGFGSELKKANITVLDLIASDDKPKDALAYALMVSIICIAIPHYVVLMLPIGSAVESEVKRFVPESLKSKPMLIRILSRSSLVAVTILLACVVRSARQIVNLVASFTIVALTVLLPPLMYIRLETLRGNKFWQLSPRCLAIVACWLFGIFTMILGCWDVVLSFM